MFYCSSVNTSCSNTAWICQKMALNKRNLFIVAFRVTSCAVADRNSPDISVRFITGPRYSLDLQHSHQRCLLCSQFHSESCHFMFSTWEKKWSEIPFTNTKGVDMAQLRMNFSLNFSFQPSIPPQSSSLPVAIVLRYIILPLCFRIVPLKATQRPFSPSSSFIFPWPGLVN